MRRRTGRIIVAVMLAALLLLVLGRVGVGFYTDLLWYRGLGYDSTFWTRLGLSVGVRSAAALLGAVVIFANLWWVARHMGPVRVRRRYGNIEIAERIPRNYVLGVATILAVLGGWWLAELQFGRGSVLAVMAWLRHVPWGLSEPLFGRDVGFYVFSLPVLGMVLGFLLLVTVWSVALVALGHVLVGGIQWRENELAMSGPARRHLGVLLAALLLLLGCRYVLSRYLLLADGSGVGGGLGYTDVEIRLPVYSAMAALSLAAAASVLYGAWRRSLTVPVVGIGVLLVGGAVLTTALPAAIQRFRVQPNELTREAPYIRWNLEFTRRAYGLGTIARQRFPYRAGARPDPQRVEPLLERLPLWDREPLGRAFNEVQSIYQYYGFPDIDYDRYGPPGQERQVGIGVREFQPEGLEPGARTWQSLRLNPSYVRGMGVVVAPTHSGQDRTGRPDLWIRELNPVVTDAAAPEALRLDRASVFFGEAMEGYAIVVPGRDGAFTGEPGVDYPEGVALDSFLRVLAFAWRFGDETLLLSGDVARDSRMVFRRSVRERLEELAPFIRWDADPLPVVHDGRVVWMVDGYTTSPSFPLARAVNIGRDAVRYLRAPVKGTVDAVTGDVTLYAVADDPILDTYRRIFPELVQDGEAMPPELRRHLRYPELALLTQAEILQEYHLLEAEPFYAGEDIWQRPQQLAAGGGVRDFRPMYALMPVPASDRVAYLAAIPFIARGRQNMTALLTARNDPDRYGELTLVEFPRDQQIPGPRQVQAVIEQDPQIAMELSLLRQRGSGVNMGNLRVLPLDSTVLYVQPLFLSAEETPIPELWRVVASDGRRVSMAHSLAAALAGLELPGVAELAPVDAEPETGPEPEPETGTRPQWSREALELLERADVSLRAGDWAGYGRAMDELRALLERLNGEG